jgi:hypothetical protein
MQERTPEPDEPKIELPEWSVEPLRAISTEIVANIRASGVRVVGNLDDMLFVPKPRVGPAPEVKVSPEIAASAAMGILVAAGLARGSGELTVNDEVEATDDVTPPEPPALIHEPQELMRVSTQQMAVVITRRLRAEVLRRVRSLRGGNGQRMTQAD